MVKDFKYAVALTGGIASGKSAAAKILKNLGFHIIDADKIAHKVLDEQIQAVEYIFSKSVIEKGKINRQALGKIVFANIQKRRTLEALIHPLIYEKIQKLASIEDQKKKPYIIDIPLFFEGKRYHIDTVIVVYVSPKKQLERLMVREGYTQKEAELRISAQMHIDKKCKKADYVIDNSATLRELKYACKSVREEILKDFK
ncbi:MAG: dephospho-CoA kinase [Epsilonproteobacteria bacterium]|nr:MAG: dephospho-CoA kinase [Campylobacterota bacterium]